MTGTTHPQGERPAPESGLSGHLLSLLASLSGYFRARAELAGIEGKEAAAVYLKVAVVLIAAIGLLAFGYAFLWIGIVALLSTFLYVHWGWLVLGVALLHLVGCAGCALAIVRLWKKPVFTGTLAEFRKDQEWLSRQK